MNAPHSFFADPAAYDRQMGGWSRRVGEIFLEWTDVPRDLLSAEK
jgi:hypothetical protein